MAQQGSLSNSKLGNKYLLGELLGFGGFGEVYKAQNLLLNRPQAIKVILEKHLSNPRFRERFIREAQTLAALNHPNILHVDDFEIEQERAYLVMPFITGGTLHSIIVQRGRLNMEETGTYLKQICAALDYAHKRNVVHLDLKPRNLLYQDGTLLLSDFGLAHLMKEGAVEGGTSLRFGSPFYMAPEQINGQPQPRSDIYALGVILYQMLVGRPPFEGSTPEAVIVKHVMEPPPPLSAKRADLPQALSLVIEKALKKNPGERYRTAGSLLQDFYASLGNTTIPESTPLKNTPNQLDKTTSGNTTVPKSVPFKDTSDQPGENASDQQKKQEAIPSTSRPWYKLSRRDTLAIVLNAVLSAASGIVTVQILPALSLTGVTIVLILPYVIGIAAAALSGRRGFDELFPAFIGGFVSGSVVLIVLSALHGAAPIEAVLIIPAVYAFLSLLGAATYVGIKKLRARVHRNKPPQAKAAASPVQIPRGKP